MASDLFPGRSGAGIGARSGRVETHGVVSEGGGVVEGRSRNRRAFRVFPTHRFRSPACFLSTLRAGVKSRVALFGLFCWRFGVVLGMGAVAVLYYVLLFFGRVF